MPNMMDYIAWRGDLPLSRDPWNAVDSLIAASVVYNPFSDEAKSHDGIRLSELAKRMESHRAFTGSKYEMLWRDLFFAMAESVRFGELILRDFISEIDSEKQMQFAAITMDTPDGNSVVAMRGTDGTVVGWHEDLNMAYKTVPSQGRAKDYLETMALSRHGVFRVVGHSKGGNLAVFAAAHADPLTRGRIIEVDSYDGPGLDDGTLASEGYAQILPILHLVIPQGSIVGRIFEYHTEPQIVRSNETGIYQHDAFSWELRGTSFINADRIDPASDRVEKILKNWLSEQAPEQREAFVTTLFGLIEKAEPDGKMDLAGDAPRLVPMALKAVCDLPAESRKSFFQQMGRFVTLAGEDVADSLKDKPQGILEKVRSEVNEGREAAIRAIESLKADLQADEKPHAEVPSLIEELKKREE